MVSKFDFCIIYCRGQVKVNYELSVSRDMGLLPAAGGRQIGLMTTV